MVKQINYIIINLLLITKISNFDIIQKNYEIYIKKYKKNYSSKKKVDHYKIFKKNFLLINPPNLSGIFSEKKNLKKEKKKLYEIEMNKFGDMSDEEFKKYYLLPEKSIYSIKKTNIPMKIKKKGKIVIVDKPVQSGILDYDSIPVMLEDTVNKGTGFFEEIFGKIKNFFGFGDFSEEEEIGVLKKKKNENKGYYENEENIRYNNDEKKILYEENEENKRKIENEEKRLYDEEEKRRKIETLHNQKIFRNQEILRKQEFLRQQNLLIIKNQKSLIKKKKDEILHKKRKKAELLFLKKKEVYNKNPFLRKIQQNVNWKERGFISPVRNQQKCNACYAFATVDAIQAYYAINKNIAIDLSAQEIIDCSKKNFECFGGQPFEALNYIIKNNLSFEKDYKYRAKKGLCAFNVNTNVLKNKEGRFLQGFHVKDEEFNTDFDFNDKNFDHDLDFKAVNYKSKPFNHDFSSYSKSKSVNKSKPFVIQKNKNYLPAANPNYSTYNTSSYNTTTQGNNTFQNLNLYKPLKKKIDPYKEEPIQKINPFYSHSTTKQKLHDSMLKLQQMQKDLKKTLPSYSQIPKITNKKKFTDVKSYRFIKKNVLELIKAVEKGPVIVAHYVSKEFKFYKKGIYTGEGCENITKVNHAALVIGYNLNSEVPYFYLKNAWGKEWGDNGFYKIKIGPLTKKNKGICLLASTEYNLVPELY